MASPCWAPWWARNVTDESQKTNMNTYKKSKRRISDCDTDSDDEPQRTKRFPNFIVIESCDATKPVTNINPFAIEKQITGILGTPKSVKKLKNETILVEVKSRQQAENLLGHDTFFGQPVEIYAHRTLNSSRGVVRCKELSLCTLAEIESNLRSQGVTAAKQITIIRNGKTIKTNTYILNFDSPTVPKEIKVGFLKVKVSVYVPNPMRCYRCQKFGHTERTCTKTPVCGRCAFAGSEHDYSTCTNEMKCLNCGGQHLARSKDCPVWKLEKETLHIKYNENLNFPDARKLAKTRLQLDETRPRSYAAAVQPASSSCQSCLKLSERITELENRIEQLLKVTKPQTINIIEPEQTQQTDTSLSQSHTSSSQSQNVAHHERVSPESDTQDNPKRQASRPGSRDSQKPVKASGAGRRSASLSPDKAGQKSKPKKAQLSDRVKKAEKNLVLSNRFDGMEMDVGDVLDFHTPRSISPVRPPN